MKKRILLCLLTLLLLATEGFSQHIRYEDNSNWFFGLNTGATWHTSDVESEYRGGLGFTFGRSFNNDYGRLFTYDLRFRFLAGSWVGQDADTTGMTGQNAALTEAYGELGYAVQNFRAFQGRAALELAIHLNSVREKSGFDPYIFGGIGYTWTSTQGDLYQADGTPYDYESNPTASAVSGSYDTPLDLNGSGEFYNDETGTMDQNLLPSLGFGLGYYFTNNFSIGLEHKSTFFNSDYFDGTIANQNGEINGNNDIYHYSGIYFRWFLKARTRSSSSANVPPPPPPKPDINDYSRGRVDNTPPNVRFTNPVSSPHTVNKPDFTLRADIEHVTSSQNVRFMQGGAENHNYTFNAITDKFQSTVTLKPGQNIFKLRGANDFGSDEATMIIIYEREVQTPQPPVVTITDPSNNPHNSSSEKRNVTANIENVSDKSSVTYSVNGQTMGSDFNFSALGNENFSKEIELVSGANIVKVTATNQYGTDSDEVTILYRREEQRIDPPVVTITQPASNAITVTEENFQLKGTILNVDSRSDVSFIQNGATNTNFGFNSSTTQFASTVVLKPGPNFFQLIGENSAGKDQKTVIITYDVPSPKPPIVNITNPTNSPHLSNNETRSITATVLNVNQANQISMTLNGAAFSDFSFNTSSSILNAMLPLNVGQNTVKISATNADGSDSKQTVIIYRKPLNILPPVVEFITPPTNPYTTENSNEDIVATVQNVDNASGLNVNVNGQNISNFNFNTSNGLLTFTSNLMLGANTVSVTGTNASGSDSKTTTIIYKRQEEKHPPVVTYISPSQNPKTVYSASFNVVAKVEHVSGSQDIGLKINGLSTSNFSYNNASNEMTFSTSLSVGANIIEITGTNPHGQDVETTTIVYQKVDPINPPIVSISTPVQATYTVTDNSTPIAATVLNVGGAQDIAVSVNNQSVTNFSFNNVTKLLQFNMSLNEGSNSLTITGTNSAGSDTDSRTIIYNKEEPVTPPYVTYTNPASAGSIVNNPTFEMVATVDHVESISGVQVVFNGQVIGSSNYSFNTATKEVRLTRNLSFGNNFFEVKGTNSAGSHSSTTNVIYEEPEEECDSPEVVFVQPSVNNTSVEDSSYMFKALVKNVSSSSDIVLKLNGQSIGNFSFNAGTNQLSRKLELTQGNNIIEVISETNCGRVDVNRIINFQPKEIPCENPSFDVIQPQAGAITEDENSSISIATGNISNMQQLQLKVNGNTQSFNYDLGTHMLNTTVPLGIGTNTILLTGTNECGTEQVQFNIVRNPCHEPNINLTPSTSSTEVSSEAYSLNGTIEYSQSNAIGLTLNGNNKNFVFDENTDNFSAGLTLEEGSNTIEVTATNSCGTDQKTFKVTYKPIVALKPPSVSITNPSSSPYETGDASHGVVATTTNITSSNQISVTVNNTSRSFNFDNSTNTITFNQSLVVGNNTIEIEVFNNDGTASDSKVIIYEEPEVILPPVVTFTNPQVTPSELEAGTYTIEGTVTNLASTSGLEVFVNNNSYSNVNASLSNGTTVFNLNLTLNSTHNQFEIRAKGTNSAGTDEKTVKINLLEPEIEEEEENCLPIVGAQFSEDHKSVTATSDKDLSNVVLKFYDGTTQKFEGLSGLSQVFSGTNEHADKCIEGIWIKSGCNQSGDGPGYGEWVPNSTFSGTCDAPCESPVINFMSNTDVAVEQYNLNVFVDNIEGNQVTITHNGETVNCSFNSATSVFSCSVDLEEGNNSFIITANGCEVATHTENVIYTVPCNPITYNLGYPSSQNYTVNEGNITINLTAQEVNQSNITASLNGGSINVVKSGSSLLLSDLTLVEGSNTVTLNMVNDCSNETITYTITYDVPQACGPRINPGNSEWQFCLVTPSGTFNRSDLQDPNFSYSGPASSLFFLPIAGGGDVTVAGSPFSVQPGKFYLFEGILTVEVSNNHPGFMGHWQVCVDSDSRPSSGNGNNRPTSPCEQKSLNTSGDNDTKTPVRKPRIKTPEKTPDTREKPSRTREENKEPTRIKRPTRTNEGTKTPTRTTSPTRTNTRTREGG